MATAPRPASCPTGKKRLTKGVAGPVAARHAQQSPLPQRPAQRVYFCRLCGGWHLPKEAYRYQGPPVDYIT